MKRRFAFIFAILYLITVCSSFTVWAKTTIVPPQIEVINSERIMEDSITDIASISNYSWRQYGPGGRHDIKIGNHNEDIILLANFTIDTWVEYYDENWTPVWSGSYSAGKLHQLRCGSNVYYVTIYLASGQFANVQNR